MIKNNYHVIGVMSGTSIDGIDLVYARFDFGQTIRFTIYEAETIAYDDFWKNSLARLVESTKEELKEIDKSYTKHISEVIRDFIKKHGINNIDAVCSHGHTALHQPEMGLTYQIGNLPDLASYLELPVVCDFRIQDVELGGQGAPLVPIGDRLLFSDYDYCINLGGFANISFEDYSENRIAFDICPANILLNYYAKKLGFEYDDKGHIAKNANLNQDLLNELNDLEFYKMDSPKSLGLEWVQSKILPMIKKSESHPEKALSTFTEHIAIQISAVIHENAKVLVTGGGAYNTHLLDRISSYKPMEIKVPKKQLIEFKEALIFGLLGVLKIRGEINCLASVTGASHDHCSGEVYNFQNLQT
ncbi:MAG: anhydro-N-acetylmuramic acid kinase [Bacteroidota bacterium]